MLVHFIKPLGSCSMLHDNEIRGHHSPHSTISLFFQANIRSISYHSFKKIKEGEKCQLPAHIYSSSASASPFLYRVRTRINKNFDHTLAAIISNLLCFSSVAGEIQLIVVNNCNQSVWPGILGSAGNPTPEDGGFHLGVGEEAVFTVPTGWSGRIWGRQGCFFDEQGQGSCDTGDCSGALLCKGIGGTPPSTVVEMTFGTAKSPLHFYDVSLVDGFNLPVTMSPIGGGIGCGMAGCEVDLNVCCPSMLAVMKQGKVVGCKSACLALQTDKYCCTGDYGSPTSCKPTLFSHIFKAICPRAYSFAYDDSSSLNMCRASRYLITFCPPPR